ncbi:MAG: hypothetical protein LBT40_10365 [Deltaproteobacteria bacterium]|jgi:uncharacterized protein YegL|nr:hypothetical protein [Deltaproteobacteria bacterium]
MKDGTKTIRWVTGRLSATLHCSSLAMRGGGSQLCSAYARACETMKPMDDRWPDRVLPDGAAEFVEAAGEYFRGRGPSGNPIASGPSAVNSEFIGSCAENGALASDRAFGRLVTSSVHAAPDACSLLIDGFIAETLNRLPTWIDTGRLPESPDAAAGPDSRPVGEGSRDAAAEGAGKPPLMSVEGPPDPPPEPALPSGAPFPPPQLPPPPPDTYREWKALPEDLAWNLASFENPAVLFELETGSDPSKVFCRLDLMVKRMPEITGLHDRELDYGADLGQDGIFSISRVRSNGFFRTGDGMPSEPPCEAGEAGPAPLLTVTGDRLGIRIRGLFRSSDGPLSLLFVLNGGPEPLIAQFEKDYCISPAPATLSPISPDHAQGLSVSPDPAKGLPVSPDPAKGFPVSPDLGKYLSLPPDHWDFLSIPPDPRDYLSIPPDHGDYLSFQPDLGTLSSQYRRPDDVDASEEAAGRHGPPESPGASPHDPAGSRQEGGGSPREDAGSQNEDAPPPEVQDLAGLSNPAILLELDAQDSPARVLELLGDMVREMPDIFLKHGQRLDYAANIGVVGTFGISRVWTNGFFRVAGDTCGGQAGEAWLLAGSGPDCVPVLAVTPDRLGIRIEGPCRSFEGQLTLRFVLKDDRPAPSVAAGEGIPPGRARVPPVRAAAGTGQERPTSAYFLIDTSPAAWGGPPETLRAGLQELFAGFGTAPPSPERLRVSVIAFDRGARTLVPMTGASDALLPGLAGTGTGPSDLAWALRLMCTSHLAAACGAGGTGGEAPAPLAFVLTRGPVSDSPHLVSACGEAGSCGFAGIVGFAAGPAASEEPLRRFCSEVLTLDGPGDRAFLSVVRQRLARTLSGEPGEAGPASAQAASLPPPAPAP